ncbi:hypothetical protein APY04_3344 [Hyphomicrobium sulfonivorans]|uniref:Uncharacterized protein n=1 Tax=Hyphomicrobium sulfonivorans TaxID=121290 RepID=A0A120CT99_HYPSL|nr:hypothetical protein APY04_3344 [Hyphomicrobium sulfonivorans]
MQLRRDRIVAIRLDRSSQRINDLCDVSLQILAQLKELLS